MPFLQKCLQTNANHHLWSITFGYQDRLNKHMCKDVARQPRHNSTCWLQTPWSFPSMSLSDVSLAPQHSHKGMAVAALMTSQAQTTKHVFNSINTADPKQYKLSQCKLKSHFPHLHIVNCTESWKLKTNELHQQHTMHNMDVATYKLLNRGNHPMQ